VSLAVVLFLQIAAASPRGARSAALTAAAQASGRPAECAAQGRPSNRWEAARDPDVERYCDLLARGFAELPFSPDTARERADAAERVSPGHAAPAILRGRAYASVHDYPHALSELERARGIDPSSLDDPATLRDLARVLARAGRNAEALAAYRALGPRLSLFPSAEDRARTFLEAAELAFGLGAPALDDAIAFLGQAKELAVRELSWRIASELALALDRRGLHEESASMAVDLARRLPRTPKPAADDAAQPMPGDQQAAVALVLELVDPRAAALAWERYLGALGDDAPWRDHAKKHLAGLKKKGAP
jgi:tetratricopeptide (TPR) repeat protein